MQTRRIIFGVLAWLGIVVGTGIAVQRQFSEKPEALKDVVLGIGGWVCGAPTEYQATAETDLILLPGDPIFLKSADGSFRQVGRVRNHFGEIKKLTYTRRASVVLYDRAVASAFPQGFVLEYHTSPMSLDSVVTTMITPERQKQIAKIIADDWKLHHKEVLERLQPIIEASVAKTVSVVQAELPVVMNTHRGDFAKMADRYQTEVVRNQIVPLIREEIMPIVQEEVRPVAAELGKDLWDRVSLWSFTWRYLYDVSPLPEKAAVKSEFKRFMEHEVTPALEARSEEFVAITERIIRRISQNEKVRAVVRENLKKVATDAELQKIVWGVVQEVVINNQTLRNTLREYWTSAEVRDALEVASTRFEPTARAIGDAIFGSRERGITPEFSRVLRSQILTKDLRWFVVVADPGDAAKVPQSSPADLIMVPAKEPMPYPLEFKGAAQSPLTELGVSASAAAVP